MFNILLIDDDISSVNILSEILPWNDLGYNLSGVFSNALQAVEFLKNNDIDVIITDIAMPNMDGLELLKLCNEQYPSIKILLISAYRNFEYAQTAVAHKNVVEYITKPINLQHLTDALKNIHAQLSEGHPDYLTLEDCYTERLSFFSNLLCGYVKSQEELQNGLESLNISLSVINNTCYIVNFHISDFSDYIKNRWKHSSIQLYNAIGNMHQFENDNAYFSISNFSYCNFSWLIIPKENSFSDDLLDVFSKNLTENMNSILNIDIIEISRNEEGSLSSMVGTPISKEYKDNEIENALQSALEYIDNNYDKNLSLSEVSGKVFMAPAYFSIYFKKKTGTNFIKHLTNIRLEHAKDLLENTNMRITEICYSVGYNHIGNFLDKFKKKYNITPNEYRKQFNNKE